MNDDDEKVVSSLLKLLNEGHAMSANLTATQQRCNELLEENRALKRRLIETELALSGLLTLVGTGTWSGNKEGTHGKEEG